nr:hypothetical protein [Mesorhizobium sp.]
MLLLDTCYPLQSLGLFVLREHPRLDLREKRARHLRSCLDPLFFGHHCGTLEAVEFAKFAQTVLQIAAQGVARHVLQIRKVGQDADLLMFAQLLFDGRDDFVVILRGTVPATRNAATFSGAEITSITFSSFRIGFRGYPEQLKPPMDVPWFKRFAILI